MKRLLSSLFVGVALAGLLGMSGCAAFQNFVNHNQSSLKAGAHASILASAVMVREWKNECTSSAPLPVCANNQQHAKAICPLVLGAAQAVLDGENGDSTALLTDITSLITQAAAFNSVVASMDNPLGLKATPTPQLSVTPTDIISIAQILVGAGIDLYNLWQVNSDQSLVAGIGTDCQAIEAL